MKDLLYIVGQPGSGKSTLLAALTEGLEPLSVEARPFAHIVWPPGIVELGARRDQFSGTDALSMSVQPKVVQWLRDEQPPAVIGEGDRLANNKFFRAVMEAGYALTIARLAVSEQVVRARREARAAALRVPVQNEQWLRGRRSKVSNIVDAWPNLVVDLDADQPPAAVAAELAYHSRLAALLRSRGDK